MRTDAFHRVETPEYVVFDFELAGLASRGAAWAIDAAIMSAILGALGIASAILGLAVPGLAGAILLAAIFLVQWGYFATFEWAWRGQTPGKRALGLRVILDSGVRMGLHHALSRNLLRILDGQPFAYLVGAAAFLLGRRRQRLGDLLAGTVVVRERRRPVPSAVVPPEERYNSFLEDPRALAAARAAVSPALREVMTGLALRRDELATEARLDLFLRLAERLRALGVPRPRALSDERFVLNATAAVLGDDPRTSARLRPAPAFPVPEP